MVIAQSAAGRLHVRCLDGSPCPMTRSEPAEQPACCHRKPCHKPLPKTCVVSTTPGVELTKPRPTEAPLTPFLALLPPSAAPVDWLTPRFLVGAAVDSDHSIPATAPPVVLHGPRAPPSHSFA